MSESAVKRHAKLRAQSQRFTCWYGSLPCLLLTGPKPPSRAERKNKGISLLELVLVFLLCVFESCVGLGLWAWSLNRNFRFAPFFTCPLRLTFQARFDPCRGGWGLDALAGFSFFPVTYLGPGEGYRHLDSSPPYRSRFRNCRYPACCLLSRRCSLQRGRGLQLRHRLRRILERFVQSAYCVFSHGTFSGSGACSRSQQPTACISSGVATPSWEFVCSIAFACLLLVSRVPIW